MNGVRSALGTLAPLTLALAASWPALSATSLKTDTLCINDHPHPISVEIADTFELRANGLMQRERLAEHQGMWFTYNQERPSHAGFWMYNTLIPLDIAYLDRSMKIVKIITMEPCRSIDRNRCPAYPPGVPYFSAVELNKDYFARYNIQEGRYFKRCEQGE